MGATASQPSPFNLDNASANLQMGSWSMQPFGSKDGLGIRAMYNASSDMGGIKGGFTLNLEYAKPRIKMDMPISGGKAGPSSYSIEGLRKLSLKVEIGSGQGVKDNQRVRLEVPVDIAQTQMYAYGLPIASTVKFKMIIELGFSSKNTTAKIRAEYGLDGPLGVANNAPLKPTVSKVLDPRDATENLSLAPFGLMVAWEVKWMVGVGTPQFMGGIYTKLAISFGAYSEGAMGFAHCESGIIQMTLSGGVGYGLSNQAKTYWNKLFGNLAAGPKAVKLEGENQVTSGKLFETGWAKPNSKYCRAE
jgi:hypothetical protein